MGVYTEVMSDDEIIEIASKFGSVVILGCASCANEAIAYSKGYLLTRNILEGNQTFVKPYAITEEMKRITKILKLLGSSVKTAFINAPSTTLNCTLRQGKRNRNAQEREIPTGDAILALCCPSGEMGIKAILDSSVEVLPIVRTVGTLYCHYIDLEEGRSVVKEKCIMVPFS